LPGKLEEDPELIQKICEAAQSVSGHDVKAIYDVLKE